MTILQKLNIFNRKVSKAVFPIAMSVGFSGLLTSCININIPDLYTGNGSVTLVDPADPIVLTDMTPVFSFYRSAASIPVTTSCTSGQAGQMAIFLVRETASASTMTASIAGGNTVYSKFIEMPDDCVYDLQVPDFEPDLYKSYAWTVMSDLATPVEDDPNWRRIIFSEFEIDLDNLPTPANNEECLKGGLINDPSFEGEDPVWTVTNRALTSGGPQLPDLLTGHNDAGAMTLTQSSPVLTSQLVAPMSGGQAHDFQISMRFEHASDQLALRVWGLSGLSTPIGGLTPSANVHLLQESAPFSPMTQTWVRHSIQSFTPTTDMTAIAIEIVSDSGVFEVAIDKVGLCNTGKGGPCDQPQDLQAYLPSGVSLPVGADYPASATETEMTTDFGAVGDIYPGSDTSTLGWLDAFADDDGSQSAGPMQCHAIGGQDWRDVDPPEGFDEDLESEYDVYLEDLESWIAETNIVAIDPQSRFRRPVPTPDTSGAAGSVCEASLDPSLPFEGRDIVYVHGLILTHLTDSYSLNRKFDGNWEDDPEDFYLGGTYDHYIREESGGDGYWTNHIIQQLGSETSPTNGYLIVNYATTERLSTGINAVANQIADAMNGDNPGVMNSTRDRQALMAAGLDPRAATCFGQNGIVIISHSTGGLLTSAMLATSELSRPGVGGIQGDFARSLYQADAGWISDQTDLHISIDGAQVGSPLASAGIEAMMVTGGLVNTPITLFQMFNDGSGLQPAINPLSSVLVDLTPIYAATHWAPLYQHATTPTITLIGTIPGLAAGNRSSIYYSVGQYLAKGFDDGVNPSISQQVIQLPHHAAPFYPSTWRVGSRWDFGAPVAKAWSMARQGSRVSPPGFVRYFVHPGLSPSGMIQTSGVAAMPPANRHAPNHYPFIQSTSSHFDPATKLDDPNEKDYAQVWFTINNGEESGVILHNDVINLGIVEADFMSDFQRQTRRQLAISIPYPCGITFNAWSQLSIDWCQLDIVIWRRNYLRLDDGGLSQNDLDYVYHYVGR